MNEKLIRGCWQLSHGHSEQKGSVEPLLDAIECGFTTFDCADIYLGVEELLGRVIHLGKKIHIHTKFVPDLERLENIDERYVESIIDRSLKRLHVECLDLVQFHWWDFGVKNYLPTMEMLFYLQAKGKIAKIGLTNVNRKYLEEFSDRFDIATLQAQVSLFDRRVERGVGALCRKKNIKILAYGSLLGGFVSEQWLGKKEPTIDQLPNRSLVKYKLLIDAACGWGEFQRRLYILSELAAKYCSDIANIAISALLQGKLADFVIVGISSKNFFTQNRSLNHLPLLNLQDLEEILGWSCHLLGDPYDEERDERGAHAKVMRYNLNAE